MNAIVVLPTYNEAGCVTTALSTILEGACHPDVLVVDDSSPDGTAEIVREIAQQYPGRVQVLERPAKQGLGRAYAAGFDLALRCEQYDAVVQMDVDGSHDPADIDRLVAALDHADLALGSRYVPGGAVVGWARSRELLSRGGNTYARLLLGRDLHDLTGGFKAWRADLLRKIDPATTISAGYGFQIEMTMRAVRHHARVVELPIIFRDRQVGESKMSSKIAIEALLGVPSMRRRLRN